MAQNGGISRKDRKIRVFRPIRGVRVEKFSVLEKTMQEQSIPLDKERFLCENSETEFSNDD
jgi:hypothetical protein